MNKPVVIPQAAVPPHDKGIYVGTSEEKLRFLGQHNLACFRAYFRRQEKKASDEINARQHQINALHEKTVEDLQELAAQYEKPEFPQIDTSGRPVDKASRSRKPGATTFNICGWCRFASDAEHGCALMPACMLMPHECGNGSGYAGTRFWYNHECELTRSTQALLILCEEHLEARKALAIGRKREVGTIASYLSHLISRAEQKPRLCAYRDDAWASPGAEIVFFDAETCQFKTGQLNRIDQSQIYFDLTDDSCSTWRTFRPEIMLRNEYDYFRQHPDYFRIWLRNVAMSYDLRCSGEAITRAIFTPEKEGRR